MLLLYWCHCRDQLLQRYRKNEHFLEVNLAILAAFDLKLHDLIMKQPNEYIPAVRNDGLMSLAC